MPSIFESLIGREDRLDTQEIYNLAIIDSTKTKRAKPKTTSVSVLDMERVSGIELERCYRADSFVFNAVNVANQMIMSAGYSVVAKKAAVRKFFENFLENISKVGADSTADEIFLRIFQDGYIHGGGWNEKVWNVGDTKIVDLKTLNPIEMDFARDSKGNVALDTYEKPIGYTQAIPFGVDTTGKGDTLPEEITLKGNQIFLLPKRISYIPLYTFGAGFIGMGRVEPAYKATIWKLNLLKAGAESSSRRGFSPIIAKVGNENVHPTPQMIQNILESVKKLDYSKYMAIPWYVELTTLDVKSIETYEGFLKYLTAMQSASLGVPVPFVTGLGEETNRATLGTQVEVFVTQLNGIAQSRARLIEKYIFKPIAEAEGFDEVPQLKWNKIIIDDIRSRQTEGEKQDKKDEQEDRDDKEGEIEKDKGKEEKLGLTSGSSVSGGPLDKSHVNQGVSYPKDKKKGEKVKIKTPKKSKV